MPREAILGRLAEALKTTPEALLTRPLYVDAGLASEPRVMVVTADDPQAKETEELKSEMDELVAIPLYDQVIGMGPGYSELVPPGAPPTEHAIIHRVALPRMRRKNTRGIVCIRAKGESMLPTIQPDSLVAIDTRDRVEIQNDKIYAVYVPDEGITLKRVRKRKGELVLIADNRDDPDYPKILTGREAEEAVRGKVVWWWSRQE